MAEDPFYIRLLTKLGVNTTRMRWKLYQLEQRKQRLAQQGGLPTGLQWLTYPHKICRHCGAVVDRDARVCATCERRVPSMTVYRVSRIFGLLMPETAPTTVTIFIIILGLVYGAMMVIDGLGAFLTPSVDAILRFGGWASPHGLQPAHLWRLLGFSLTHYGIIHIGFNCFAASQVGPALEGHIGSRRMLVVITACQIGAALATFFWYTVFRGNATFLTAGASGWVFGLIGFGVVYFHRMGESGRMYRDALMRWVIYGIIFGLVIRANNAAHIGGMATGAALALVAEERVRKNPLSDNLWKAAFWVSLLLWTITLASMFRSIATHTPVLGG